MALPLVLIVLLAAACTQHRARTVFTMSHSSDGWETAAADTVDFDLVLAAHGELPSAERAERRDRAEKRVHDWRRFEVEAFREKDRHLRHWYYRDDAPTVDYLGIGLGNSIIDLKAAGAIDPSFAEAWSSLGRLCGEVGDWPSARRYLERAMVVAEVQADAGRPLPGDQLAAIYRDLAWVYRDLALWDEGLATVARGLQAVPDDPELALIKGLLLAGSGRFSAAISQAVRMDPVRYPQYDFLHRGFRQQTSAYANNWIKSQAFLAVGDLVQAYRVLGDLATLAYRSQLPYSTRYWRDAGLVAELHGDPEAPVYYAVGHVTRDYLQFYPVMAQNVAPQVLDLPRARSPVFTSYGSRFYSGGSPFSYVGLQMNLMASGLFAGQRGEAAGRALLMLDVLERRGIRPDVCRALRGRISYVNDDFEAARRELTAAHGDFSARGEVDAGTSLLLGLLQMQVQAWDAARSLLVETVEAAPDNPVAWRSLGVVQIKTGETEAALAALDRAVAIDPWSVTSFYNRGLYHLQRRDFGPATRDLERALLLDPENREVQRLLQMAAAAQRTERPDGTVVASRSDGPPAGFDADPQALLDRLDAEVEAAFDLPDSLRASSPDLAARVAELEKRYVQHPSAELRAILALAYIDQRRFRETQALLAPGWSVDLTPNEELMLLYVDRQLGEVARAEQVVREVLVSGDGSGDPYAVAIAVRSLQTGVNPVGEDFVAKNFHGFFGWWRSARYNYRADTTGRRKFVADVDLYRRYMDDPMFEQAVWGMTQTPLTGRQTGVPNAGTAAK